MASAAEHGDDLSRFRSAGRVLFSMGLVKGAEGNLSTFDGRTLRITRTGAALDRLEPSDILEGAPAGPFAGASSDVEVHRAMYRTRGPGAVAHAHPSGTVPEGQAAPGEHGVYAFGASLNEAVEDVVRRARTSGAAP